MSTRRLGVRPKERMLGREHAPQAKRMRQEGDDAFIRASLRDALDRLAAWELGGPNPFGDGDATSAAQTGAGSRSQSRAGNGTPKAHPPSPPRRHVVGHCSRRVSPPNPAAPMGRQRKHEKLDEAPAPAGMRAASGGEDVT